MDTRTIITHIECLNEMDTLEVLHGIASHIEKQNINHIIDIAFEIDDFSEEIEDLESDLGSARDELEEAQELIDELKTQRAKIEILIEDGMNGSAGDDYYKDLLSKIKELL